MGALLRYWLIGCFLLAMNLADIQDFLEDIVEGSLGVKEGQKFVWNLPWKERLRARAFRQKLKRFHREFEGYLRLRRVLMAATAVCLIAETALWLCTWQEAAELLAHAHALLLTLLLFGMNIHARAYWNRSKYNRARPTKEERGHTS